MFELKKNCQTLVVAICLAGVFLAAGFTALGQFSMGEARAAALEQQEVPCCFGCVGSGTGAEAVEVKDQDECEWVVACYHRSHLGTKTWCFSTAKAAQRFSRKHNRRYGHASVGGRY